MARERKIYQSHRTDLLINTEFGISKEEISKQEAKQKELTLFKGFWVTQEEKTELKKQFSAYYAILQTSQIFRIVGVMYIILAFVHPVFQEPIIRIPFCIFGILVIIVGVGISRYKKWSRIAGNIIGVLTLPSILLPLMAFTYLNSNIAKLIFSEE